jgi:hypothetical protein
MDTEMCSTMINYSTTGTFRLLLETVYSMQKRAATPACLYGSFQILVIIMIILSPVPHETSMSLQ